jgi:hypothetical protein
MSKTFWIAFFAKLLQAVMIIVGAFVVVPIALPFAKYQFNCEVNFKKDIS